MTSDFIIKETPKEYFPKMFSEIRKLNMVELVKKPPSPIIIPTQIKS